MHTPRPATLSACARPRLPGSDSAAGCVVAWDGGTAGQRDMAAGQIAVLGFQRLSAQGGFGQVRTLGARSSVGGPSWQEQQLAFSLMGDPGLCERGTHGRATDTPARAERNLWTREGDPRD